MWLKFNCGLRKFSMREPPCVEKEKLERILRGIIKKKASNRVKMGPQSKPKASYLQAWLIRVFQKT